MLPVLLLLLLGFPFALPFGGRTAAQSGRPPMLTIDVPTAGRVSPEGFDIGGWAVSLDNPSPPGVDAVHVWAFPAAGGAPQFIGAATMGIARPDVALAFGAAYQPSGFQIRAVLPAGTWFVAAYPHDAGNGFTAPRTVRVVVRPDGERDVVTGADAGGSPHVLRFPAAEGPDAGTAESIIAGDAAFTGGVRVAHGDVNGDGIADIIAGWGPGAEPRVFVYDGRTGAGLASFNAFEPSFRGGVFVAAGDVDGDGYAEVVVASGPGHPPEVNLFRGPDFRQIRHYSVFDFSFRGGISVAVGDVNGDGAAEVLVGTGPGVPGQVLIFDGVNGTESPRVAPYGAFTGGIYVAAGDVNGDGFADIITGAGAGGGPHVRVFDGQTRAPGRQFYAIDPAFRGGVRVAAGDVNGDGRAEILASPGPGRRGSVSTYDAATGTGLTRWLLYDPAWSGGVFVATATPQNRMAIETPLPGTVPNAFRISGWAFNENPTGTDIDLIDIWAIGVFGGGPIYLGQAVLGEARPDVASRFGSQYINSGFHLDVSSLSPAVYDIAVSARSATSHTFRLMRVVRVTVNP